MALELEEKFKGITANYWKILSMFEDYFRNRTSVKLGLYKDEEARHQNIENYLTSEVKTFDNVDMTREDAYIKIKESKKIIKKEINPEGEKIEVEVETNKFVEAEDC